MRLVVMCCHTTKTFPSWNSIPPINVCHERYRWLDLNLSLEVPFRCKSITEWRHNGNDWIIGGMTAPPHGIHLQINQMGVRAFSYSWFINHYDSLRHDGWIHQSFAKLKLTFKLWILIMVLNQEHKNIAEEDKKTTKSYLCKF